MATAIKTYLCEVDLYRNGMVFRDKSNRLYDRNTEGSYLVGARSKKEAKKLLQKAIGFGSVTVPNAQYRPDGAPALKHNEIVKIIRDRDSDARKPGGTVSYGYKYEKNFPKATDPVKTEG